jgi:hypothetical protein
MTRHHGIFWSAVLLPLGWLGCSSPSGGNVDSAAGSPSGGAAAGAGASGSPSTGGAATAGSTTGGTGGNGGGAGLGGVLDQTVEPAIDIDLVVVEAL